MTMIDEQSLEQLLAWAADEIEVPADGPDRIEAAAEALDRRPLRAAGTDDTSGDAPRGRTVRALRSKRPYRVAAVAASIVLVGLILAATLGSSGSSGPKSQIFAAPVTPARSAHAGSAIGAGQVAGNAAVAQENQALQAQLGTLQKRAAGAPGQLTGPTGADVAGPKIESTGSMNLTVPHLDQAVSALTTLVAGDGGYVAAEQTQSASPGVPASGTVTLQVPQTSFSTLVNQVKRLGVSSQVSTKDVDVTGQYVDLQAQVTALRATQEQYLTIMTRAQTIGDILAVQQELDTIDSQLQQVEGEQRLLDSETSYGTLTVELSEPGPKPAPAPKPAPKPPTGLAAAWGSARHGFANGVYWVVRQSGGLAFLILVAGLLYLLGRVGWRGLRRLAL